MENANTIGGFVNRLSPKEKALFYKLWELVKRGVDGEQENAKRLIEIFCEKRGSKWEQLENTSEEALHTIHGITNKEIFVHVCAKVLDSWDIRYYRVGKGELSIMCTPEQAAEIEILVDIYQKAYIRELRKLRIAFLYAHNLFPQTANYSNEKQPESADVDIVEMSESEYRRYKKKQREAAEHNQLIREAGIMASTISGVRVQKRLESGEDD